MNILTMDFRITRGTGECLLLVYAVSFGLLSISAFNVGLTSTRCNTDPARGEILNPCMSLYNAECGGTNCRCPAGTVLDENLGNCKRGAGGGRGSISSPGGAFDDLPFDFDPNKPGGGAGGSQPAPAPAPQPAPQPGSVPRQPYNPSQPNQPDYNPNQPGYNPNQPGYNPNQPGYNPNQPGYIPTTPKSVSGGTKGGGGDPHLGEKAGGGFGGVVGILLLVGLIYYCCFRGKGGSGSKFQNLPFMRGRGGGEQQQQPPDGVAMYPITANPNMGPQPNMPGGYAPPPNMPPQDPNMQAYGPPPNMPQPGYPGGSAPPAGFYPDPSAPGGYQPQGLPYPVQPGQQPPPYSPQYQPGAPPM